MQSTISPNATQPASEAKRPSGGYRFLFAVILLLWLLGLLDLINSESDVNDAAVGRFSPLLFGFIVVYALGSLVWLTLIFYPPAQTWFKGGLKMVQNRFWLALPLLGLLAYLANVPLSFWRFEPYKGLQLTWLGMMGLFTAVLLFANWQKQAWRLVILGALGLILTAELLLQGLAFAGALPFTTEHVSLSYPYARVYDNTQGLGNGITNRYGWYYPEFTLDPNATKIALIGDGFVQASQTPRDQNVGLSLQTRLNQGATPPTEVLGMGRAGFGPAQYLEISRSAVAYYDVDEVILFVNLNDDFTNLLLGVDPRTERENVFYDIDESGFFNITKASFNTPLHFLDHALNDHHNALYYTALSSARSHSFLIKWLRQSGVDLPKGLRNTQVTETVGTTEEMLATGSFIFSDPETAEFQKSVTLMDNLLELTQLYTAVPLSIVTVPTFSQTFYAEQPSQNWQPISGDLDLFQPEAVLQTIAAEHGFSLLSMGSYMQAQGLTTEEVAKLYMANGQGFLSPEGYNFFAEAAYDCFYSNASQQPGCYLP